MSQIHVKANNVDPLLWLGKTGIECCDEIVSNLTALIQQCFNVTVPVFDIQTQFLTQEFLCLLLQLILLCIELDDDLRDIFHRIVYRMP